MAVERQVLLRSAAGGPRRREGLARIADLAFGRADVIGLHTPGSPVGTTRSAPALHAIAPTPYRGAP